MQSRKVLLFVAVAVLAFSSFGFAANKNRNEVSLDLFSPILLNITSPISVPIYIDYQRMLNDHLVLSLIPAFYYSQRIATTDSYVFEPWIELDWHPWGEGLNGFFVGPAIGIPITWIFTSGLPDVRLQIGAGIGVAIGYQFVFSNGLALDLSAGILVGYTYSFASQGEPAQGGFGTPPGHLSIALGYQF
jgi:hypothetical protein